MDCVSVKDAAQRWGVSPRLVQRMLSEGRIQGARKCGSVWLLPADAEKPADPRKRTKKPPAHAHRLPRRCVMLTMSTLYDRPGNAKSIMAALSGDQNARTLFQAELHYLRGEVKAAAAVCQSLLEKTDCFDTRLGCLLTLANAAMYTGDFSAWTSARSAIAQTGVLNEAEAATRDCSLACVDSALFDRRGFPEWLKIGRFDPLPVDGFPAARHMYAKYCAISRADFALLPALEPLCSQTRAEGAVGAEIYLRLVVAAGYHDCGNNAAAAFHVSRALDLALPDSLYAPLAEARRNIGVLFDDLLRARDESAYRAVCALWEALIPTWTALYQKRMGRSLSAELTLREMEAVKYAATGMTNEAIASLMHISVSTVRSHIASAMQKTGVTNRDGFAEYMRLS